MRAISVLSWFILIAPFGCTIGVTDGPDAPLDYDAATQDLLALDEAGSDAEGTDAWKADATALDATASDALRINVTAPDALRIDVTAPDATTPCGGGLTSCGGSCVNVLTATSHCGVCGRACPASTPCISGVCRDLCAGNSCSGHGWCQAGLCLCDPGYAGSTCASCDGVWQALSGVSPVVCTPVQTLDGTAGDDTLAGTVAPETIRGLDGNDTIQGSDGNDLVNGNVGVDTVNGNVGRDEVHGGAENDLVQGGAGDDLVVGGNGDDRVVGGGGNDRLVGGEGNDTLEGVDGDDRYMIDGLGNDVIDDLVGADAARCVSGVFVVSNSLVGGDRLLRLNNGGTVTILGDRVESILGCE